MVKTDLKAERRDLYSPSPGRFVEVIVPEMTFLAVDGTGDPNTSRDYVHAVEALFAVSYAAKFISKSELNRDYVVMPLEGLWSAADYTAFEERRKDAWTWTMMIRQPDWIDASVLEQAHERAQAKGLPALPLLRSETLVEGLCVQTLHVGSYDDEAPVLSQLHHQYLPDHGLTASTRHHEIYLSDPRRTAPAKLKTILRQPVTVNTA